MMKTKAEMRNGLIAAAVLALAAGAAGEETAPVEAEGMRLRVGERAHVVWEWEGGEEELEGADVEASCDCVQVTEAGRSNGLNRVGAEWAPAEEAETLYEVTLSREGKVERRLVFVGTATGWMEGRDWELYADVETEEGLVANPGGAHWLDLRDEETFGQSHVPGAENFREGQARTAGARLAGQRVAVLDEGGVPQRAERVCHELRAQGVDAVVWYGGMNAWRRRGGAVEGAGPHAANRLEVRSAFGTEHLTDWLVADASGEAGEEAFAEGAADVGSWKDGGALAERLEAALEEAAERRGEEALCVLLATGEGEGYPVVERALKDFPAYVYFLKGGKKAWAGWQKAMTTAAGPAHLEITTSGSGGSGGCGSCEAKRRKRQMEGLTGGEESD